MGVVFAIEDEMHAQLLSQHASRAEAMTELQRIARVPWGTTPNRPPCNSSATCRRSYELIEYDDRATPWVERSRIAVLEIDAEGVRWNEGSPA